MDPRSNEGTKSYQFPLVLVRLADDILTSYAIALGNVALHKVNCCSGVRLVCQPILKAQHCKEHQGRAMDQAEWEVAPPGTLLRAVAFPPRANHSADSPPCG